MSPIYPDKPREDVLEPEPWDDPAWNERHTARFVIPIWKDQRHDEDSQDLHECASCSQFFVTRVALRVLLGEGRERGQCLSFCICPDCAPYVLKATYDLKAHGTSAGATA